MRVLLKLCTVQINFNLFITFLYFHMNIILKLAVLFLYSLFVDFSLKIQFQKHIYRVLSQDLEMVCH